MTESFGASLAFRRSISRWLDVTEGFGRNDLKAAAPCSKNCVYRWNDDLQSLDCTGWRQISSHRSATETPSSRWRLMMATLSSGLRCREGTLFHGFPRWSVGLGKHVSRKTPYSTEAVQWMFTSALALAPSLGHTHQTFHDSWLYFIYNSIGALVSTSHGRLADSLATHNHEASQVSFIFYSPVSITHPSSNPPIRRTACTIHGITSKHRSNRRKRPETTSFRPSTA